MTSMLCRKETGGQVVVHDADLIEDLSVDNNDQIRTLMVSKKRSAERRRLPRPNTTPSPSRSQSRNMDTNSLIGKTMKMQHWLNEKTVRTLQESRIAQTSCSLGTSSGRTSKVSPGCNTPSESMTEQEKSDLESKAARKLYSPLLQTEDTFVKDVEDFIHRREMTNLRKKEVLHKNWNERVYKPMRKKIIEAMDSNDWPEVDRRKRELHRQYLEFTNEKGHVFLDTMDPEEYYAMALNGHRPAPIKMTTTFPNPPYTSSKSSARSSKRSTISQGAVVTMRKAESANDSANSAKNTAKSATRESKGGEATENVQCAPPKCAYVEKTKHKQITHVIETRPLHDPLISQGRQRCEEDRTILRCLTGYRYSDKDIEQVKMPTMPLVPLGRHGTDSIRWLEMPLSNIESTPRLASRRRMQGKFNNTDIDFEEWSRTPYNHSAVDKELQIQKKRMYEEDQKPPFPKPLIRRIPVPAKPVQRSVSFQNPVSQEIMALEPVTQSVPQTAMGVSAE